MLEITGVNTNNIGYNPITKEDEIITEWLNDKNHLVFIIDGNRTPLCLERNYLNSIQKNYILYLCDINDNIYVKKTANKKDIITTPFIDIGKYNLIEDTVINYKHFSETINNKQVFLITKINSAPPITLFNEETIMNINKFHKTLMLYSGNTLYKQISSHFIHGTEIVKAIKNHISNMDNCFMEYAQVTKNNDMIVYRGMKTPYDIKLGESMIIRNYLSTTTTAKPSILNGFQNQQYYKSETNQKLKPKKLPLDINNCCIYKIQIDKGIPYIDMKFSTNYKNESEILLPRNLLITYIKDYISTELKMHVRVLTIGKSTKDQFESINKKQCSNFKQANISPVNVIFTNENVNPSPKPKPMPIGNLKRCPKGTRKNKKTGNCDPNVVAVSVPNVIPVPNVVVSKRCPKGTRKNKKTGICDPIN